MRNPAEARISQLPRGGEINFGEASFRALIFAPVENSAAPPRPFAVMAAADEREAPPHVLTAGHLLCLSAQATASPMGHLGPFPEKGLVQYRRHRVASRNKHPPMSLGCRSACGTEGSVVLLVELRELVASEATARGEF